MGLDLNNSSFAQLWILVLKRLVYLVSKFISFKGAAFIVCCIFCVNGTISGAVWCSLILGIITNRTGKQVMEKHFFKDNVSGGINEMSDSFSRSTTGFNAEPNGTAADRIKQSGQMAKSRLAELLYNDRKAEKTDRSDN